MYRWFYEFAKKVYVLINRFKWARRLKRKVKAFFLRRERKAQKRFIDRFYKKYSDITLEEAELSEVQLPPMEGKYFFGFDAFGQIRGIGDRNVESFCDAADDILDSPDILVRLTVTTAEETETAPDAFECLRSRLSLYALTPGAGFLFRSGEAQIIAFGFTVPRAGDEKDPKPEEFVLKVMSFAKRISADYVVGYCLREDDPSTSSTAYERAYLRLLANLGCGYIFGSDICGIYNGGNFRRIDGSYTDALISMGGFFGSEGGADPLAENAAIAIRVKLVDAGKTSLVANKGYIPLFFDRSEEPSGVVMRIDYHNSEHHSNPEIMDTLSYIEDHAGKLRDIRNIITLRDIFSILKEPIPAAYENIMDISVGKVCARSFEVETGDVFFFKEPFQDPNDGEPAPLELRLRGVEKAVANGCRFIFSYVPLELDVPHYVMDHVMEAHISVCAYLRKNYPVRTIGITGSIGKTSTKDMLFNVMAEHFKTYRNLRNSNTQVNIGLHIQDFRGNYEIFLQEIGGGRPGGASRHSRMILPEAAVVTNIGLAHIGNFGTQEKLMENKLGIVDGMDSKGTLFLNGDDPLLRTAKVNRETVFYAVQNHDVDYYAENIREEHGDTSFEIVHGEHRVKALLHVLGEYNVLNAVCCYAIGKKFKLTDEEIVRGIEKFETSGVRQNLMKVGGYQLFVDCFNASPASIESALSVLDSIETEGKKIAVIGDVTGIGDATQEVHEEIGNIVSRHHMDKLICFGEQSVRVHEICSAAGIDSISLTDSQELRNYLRENVAVGDVVAFKGSSKNKLTRRIDQVYGTMLEDQFFIDKMKYREVTMNGLTYYVYESYGTLMNSKPNLKKAKMAHRIQTRYSRRIEVVGEGAFADQSQLETVTFSRYTRHIGSGSFINCGALTSLKMPNRLLYIGESAFEGCMGLKEVLLNDRLRHIGAGAFSGCSGLEQIRIPASVTQMDANVFAGCSNLKVCCYAGSYAEQYCRENGLEYEILSEEKVEA